MMTSDVHFVNSIESEMLFPLGKHIRFAFTALRMNSRGPCDVVAVAGTKQSATAARDCCSGSVMEIRSPLQRKIDNFIGRSLPFQLISSKTRPTIVQNLISGDSHHFLADSWANSYDGTKAYCRCDHTANCGMDVQDSGATLLRQLHEHPIILAKRIGVTEYRGECNHFVRSKVRREVHCLNCDQHKILVPRCHFELNITDDSGTLTAIVSETLGERLLSVTAEQIYETVDIKNELLPIAHIKQQLAHKVFSLQLQKSLFRIPDQKPGTLIISSLIEKEDMFSPKFPLSMLSDETSKKSKITPSTPTKKQ
ncbi:hypothetical protein HAX54_024872 [Datura stramonium]|uniref:Replication factor A C-terminal domain-containing protein n=1 Tax=Datura stramonium TaxID=4076 RepID=A0ABS8UYT1_DATST|nr:hypothetical protein [Datura stramonium]